VQGTAEHWYSTTNCQWCLNTSKDPQEPEVL
jgi:hypothetical protein